MKNFDKLKVHFQEELITYKKNLNAYNQQFLFKRENSGLDEFIIIFRDGILEKTKLHLKENNILFQEYLFNFDLIEKYKKELELVEYKISQFKKQYNSHKNQLKIEESIELTSIHSLNSFNNKIIKNNFTSFTKLLKQKELVLEDYELVFNFYFNELKTKKFLSEIFLFEENLG